MNIKQLSVFLENKSGRLNEILDILGKAEIRIIAASVADTSEYGILRLITSDTSTAYSLLKENHISAHLSDVIAISCNPLAGTFANQLKCFSQENISIEYMYCFSFKDRAFLILRTDNNSKAGEIALKYHLNSVSEDELIRL